MQTVHLLHVSIGSESDMMITCHIESISDSMWSHVKHSVINAATFACKHQPLEDTSFWLL